MPFQTKYELKVNSIEAAKRALPFFGGTSAEPNADTTDTTNNDTTQSTSSSATTSTDTGNTGGGDAALTPEAIAALVAKNLELEETAKTAAKKLEGYEKQETEAQKAKMTEIERAQTEIRERDETIVAMDRVVRSMAVENAIMNAKDMKFHSTKHVINELDPTEYEIDVDLKNGTATVSNLDKALKRIATENPWMLVDPAKDNPGNATTTATRGNPNPGGATRRGSGAPPSPGAARQSDATQRRSELMKKFPVIARGARTG